VIGIFSKSNEDEKELGKKKDKEELYDIIKRFKNINREDIKEGAHLEKDLGLDSLDIVELSMALEEKYNVDADSLMLSRDTDVSKIDEMLKNPPKERKKLPFFKFPYFQFFIFVRSVTQFLLFPFIRMLYRSRIYGRQNLKDMKEPVVFAANHTSLMDSVVILYSLPFRIRRRLATIMSIEHHFGHFFYKKGNIFRRAIEAIGFFSFICLILNVIPLSRTYGFKQSLENVGHLLDKGWYILIFPEGAITRDGSIKDFEPGIGIISKDMDAPVVPIRVDGLFKILYNGILPLGHLPRIPLIKTFHRQKA
jgi:long-chain acyl-CoA synthetase